MNSESRNSCFRNVISFLAGSQRTPGFLFTLRCMRPRPRACAQTAAFQNSLLLRSRRLSCTSLFNEVKFLIKCIMAPHQTFFNTLVNHMVLGTKPEARNQRTSSFKSRRSRKNLPQSTRADVAVPFQLLRHRFEMKSPYGFLEMLIRVLSYETCCCSSVIRSSHLTVQGSAVEQAPAHATWRVCNQKATAFGETNASYPFLFCPPAKIDL